MIDIYVNDILFALKNRCYFSALAFALALPDICGAAEFSDDTPVAKRYIGWYDRYVFPNTSAKKDEEAPALTGELVYNLRNTFLHQGSPTVNRKKIKAEREQVDKFVLLLGDGTKVWDLSSSFGVDLRQVDPEIGVVYVRLFLVDVSYLCNLISSAASAYYADNQDKFSFDFSVDTQEHFFSSDPSVVDAVDQSIEKDPIGTLINTKLNNRVNVSDLRGGNLTKSFIKRLKSVSPLLKTAFYYEDHAKEYAALTVKADMSPAYDRFLAYLPAGAAILDAGCGSGRDSLCFMKKGYAVTMLDASEEMCKCAEVLTGQKALHKNFDEIDFADKFDGIWACASLLHVPEKYLASVLIKFWRALKRDGVLYASWKYGEAERSDGERFYCDMTEEKLRNVLARLGMEACEGLEANKGLKAHAGLFDCLECWVAEDSLPSGREQKWLNVVLRKKYK